MILLTHLSRELEAGGFTTDPPCYQQLYRAILAARFPARRDEKGRWAVRRADLPAVIPALVEARAGGGLRWTSYPREPGP